MPNQPMAGNRGHYISAIPDELWAKARAKSATTGVSISEVVRQALEEWVKEREALAAAVRSAAEQGFTEVELARQAGVDRLTIRRMLGKG